MESAKLAALGLGLFALAYASNSATDHANNYAIVVGVTHAGELRDIPGADNDADSMSESLQACGFKVWKLTSKQRGGGAINPRNWQRVVRELRDAGVGPNDVILLFWAGHGFTAKFGGQDELYLPTRDFNETSPRTSSLPLIDVDGDLANLHPGCVIAMIDTCRSELVGPGDGPQRTDPSGARMRGRTDIVGVRDAKLLSVPENSPVPLFALFATQNHGFAIEAPREEDGNKLRGLFASAIQDGLNGAAALDDGTVTLGSLTEFVQEQTPRDAAKFNKSEQPIFVGRGKWYSVPIALGKNKLDGPLHRAMRYRYALSRVQECIKSGLIDEAVDFAVSFAESTKDPDAKAIEITAYSACKNWKAIEDLYKGVKKSNLVIAAYLNAQLTKGDWKAASELALSNLVIDPTEEFELPRAVLQSIAVGGNADQRVLEFCAKASSIPNLTVNDYEALITIYEMADKKDKVADTIKQALPTARIVAHDNGSNLGALLFLIKYSADPLEKQAAIRNSYAKFHRECGLCYWRDLVLTSIFPGKPIPSEVKFDDLERDILESKSIELEFVAGEIYEACNQAARGSKVIGEGIDFTAMAIEHYRNSSSQVGAFQAAAKLRLAYALAGSGDSDEALAIYGRFAKLSSTRLTKFEYGKLLFKCGRAVDAEKQIYDYVNMFDNPHDRQSLAPESYFWLAAARQLTGADVEHTILATPDRFWFRPEGKFTAEQVRQEVAKLVPLFDIYESSNPERSGPNRP